MAKLIYAAALATALIHTQITLAQETPPGQGSEKDVLFLDQNWSYEDRLRYYNTSQGSAVVSYDIFLNLEQADSEELFRSAENSRRYGLVPQEPDSTYNPDGLPIGINKADVPQGRWKGAWMGLGCASCHNGQIEYKSQKIRIAGGSNILFDVLAYIDGLDKALAATIEDNAKFDRLASRMGATDQATKGMLRQRLESDAKDVHYYSSVIALPASPVGPGRVDALTLIHSQIQANVLGVPENWRASISPAKYSFVWNLPQSAWAQWPGIRKDPILRNLGEVLAVFARFNLRSPTPEQGLFESTVDLKGQFTSEELLRKLAPPPWPEQVLGKIDRAKAEKGKTLFVELCSSCHSTFPHRWSEPKVQGKRFIENALVPADVVGTDTTMLASPVLEPFPTSIAGNLSPYLEAPFTGKALATSSAMFNAAQRGVYERKMKELNLTPEELVSAHGYRTFYPNDLEPVPADRAFKANPADGMWASPPFLHNGSVPNLYELLLPAAERSKTFFIGREFDPIKVGVDTSGNSGTFLFDTALVGNGNAGHSFQDGSGRGVIGRNLAEDERWALVEYLKSIPDAPNQVSPFGGPENPKEAWKDESFFHVRNPGTYNGAPQLTPSSLQKTESAPGLGEETIDPGEAEFIQFIEKATIDRLKGQFPEGQQPVLRDAHPKTHALVKAQFIVPSGLPEELRYGVFKDPRTFDAVIRFSAGGIEVKSDEVPQANGMAIKLLGVEGEKLLANEKDAKTQDFVMINNFPSFFVRNLHDYQAVHEALGAEDPTAGTAKFFSTHPDELAAVTAMRGAEPLTSPFDARYWSQTPFRMGPKAMKFSARPISVIPPVTEHKGPDFLRDVARDQIGKEDIYFEFLVQLQTDPVAMPVEDSLVVWDEAKAPFQRVAIIRIPKQAIEDRNMQLAEELSFNPWHSVPDHQPIGAINRARKAIYEALSEFRHGRNGVARVEPTTMPF